MKVQLRLTKGDQTVHSGAYDIADADSFAAACADAWVKIKRQQMAAETSVGALMEHLEESVLDLLNGARINLDKI